MIGGCQAVDELWQTQLPVCVLVRQLDQSVHTQGSDTVTRQPSQWNHKPYLLVFISIIVSSQFGLKDRRVWAAPQQQVRLQSVGVCDVEGRLIVFQEVEELGRVELGVAVAVHL